MNKKSIALAMSLLCISSLSKNAMMQPFVNSSAVNAFAYNSEVLSEGDYDNIHWSVNSDNQLVIKPKTTGKTAEISDFFITLENPDPLSQNHFMEIVEYQPWKEYNEKITSVFIEDGITVVGAYAFHDMPNLTSVHMADSVGRIGKKAFYALPLTNVKWSSGLYNIEESAFQGVKLKEIILPNEMKIIGDSVFQNCNELEQIIFPNTMTKIGTYAFKGCSSLTEITLPDSLVSLSRGSFYGCTSLKSVVFGNGLQEIPWQCFGECKSLEIAVIDNNITSIGNSAFSDCSELSYVYISDNVTKLGDGAFSNCIDLEKMIILNPTLDLTYMDSVSHTNYTMYGVKGSTSQKYAEKNSISFEEYGNIEDKVYPFAENLKWTIKDGILIISGEGEIPDYTFSGDALTKDTPWAIFAPDITAVEVENGITRIGDRAFYLLENAVSVKLPTTLKSIGDNAFQKCGVTELTIPEGVSEVGMQALRNCTKLVSIGFPSTLETIPDNICGGCTSLEKAAISEGTKVIGDSAFSFCTSLETVVFPESLETIKAAAFTHCTALSEVTLGNQLRTIEGAAFQMCKSLKTLKLGESVNAVGEGAFRSCGLTGEITIPATVSSLGGYAFFDCPNIKAFRVLAPKLTLNNSVYPLGYVSGENAYNAIATTIYGYSGSKTSDYAARENVFTFVALDWDFPVGDVNLDGKFNISDVVLLQKWLLSAPNAELKYWQAADLCEDNRLDVFDLCLMKKELLKNMESSENKN